MKIVILSDIHDNLVNLEKCQKWCKANSIQATIFCGDLTNSETLSILANNFSEPIYMIKGNVELYDEHELKNYKSIIYYGQIGYFKLAEKNIGICHEPYLIDKVLKQGSCDMVFYGHTHKPWIEKRKNARIINPGNMAGVINRATFSSWDTESGDMRLHILDEI
ncbi:YfcE family phosphodiesterase [bacterium]|nr:YfcE family phosphodiesterase [bacterium]